MIDRNLGTIERVIRLGLGLAIVGAVISRPSLSAAEIFVGLAGLALILNGIFSRCYLWRFLNLSSCKDAKSNKA